MTGGQPAGRLHRAAIRYQVAAEGVTRIAIVADEADRLPEPSAVPKFTTLHIRGELDAVRGATSHASRCFRADL